MADIVRKPATGLVVRDFDQGYGQPEGIAEACKPRTVAWCVGSRGHGGDERAQQHIGIRGACPHGNYNVHDVRISHVKVPEVEVI